MTVPDRVTASWIATLGNVQLVAVESRLHSQFVKEDDQEKRRRGNRYALLRGPEGLVNAWLRWLMVNNETRIRGLLVRHRKSQSRIPLGEPPHDPHQRQRAEKTTVWPVRDHPE